MILYDKKGNYFDIFELKAVEEDLINYRRDKMKKIPENLRALSVLIIGDPQCVKNEELYWDEMYRYAKTYYKYSRYLKLPAKTDDKEGKFDILVSPYDTGYILEGTKHKENLIDRYYSGSFKDKNVTKIKYFNSIKYFILNHDHYNIVGENDRLEKVCFSKDFYDMIQLPKSLYLLQLLEQGKFTELEGKDISEQLALYTLGKINEVSMDELQKMDSCGITKNARTKFVTKAQDDARVLKLIRKYK